MTPKTIAAAAITAAAFSFALPALAQAPSRDPGPCPASGFHAPLWGVYGGNDGIQHPHEVMGPCTPPAVGKALTAMGLGRSRPLTEKAVMSVRFSATGNWVDPVAGPVTLDNATWDIHYYYPAARAEIKGKLKNGKAFSNVEVIDDALTWDETGPGWGPKKAPAAALQERAIWTKLFPQGAMLSLVEAEGTAKVGKDASGATTITGKSPYEPYTVSAVLNADDKIEWVTVVNAGHTYKAHFIGYNKQTAAYDPVNNPWEPAYWVTWPHQIVWTKDGKPYADFHTTAFKSNAYMVFPHPELQKAEAEEADPTWGYDKHDPKDPRNQVENQFTPDMNVPGKPQP